MLIPFTPAWRGERDRRRRARAYLAVVGRDPEDVDVRWLAEAAAGGDVDHARWELRYARWVLGVLAAQRDALDDATGSEVVVALVNSLQEDARVAPERLAARGGAVGSGERLGRVLLAFASDGARSAGAPLARAVELLSAYLAEAN